MIAPVAFLAIVFATVLVAQAPPDRPATDCNRSEAQITVKGNRVAAHARWLGHATKRLYLRAARKIRHPKA